MPRSAKITTKPAALKDIEAGLRQLTIGLRGLAREISSGKSNGMGMRRRKVTKALRQKGVTVLYEDKHPHAGGADHYAVFFEDPDRTKVELVAPEDY